MRKAGVLNSKMGKGGGYYLLKDANNVLLSDVIRMFNGPIALLPCASINNYKPYPECVNEVACGLNKMMIEVRDETLKILENKSLQDMINVESKKNIPLIYSFESISLFVENRRVF